MNKAISVCSFFILSILLILSTPLGLSSSIITKAQQITTSVPLSPNPSLSTIQAQQQKIPPVANAGPNQVVGSGSTVMLDGSRSYDQNPGGTLILYRWTQTAGIPVALAASRSSNTANGIANDGSNTAYQIFRAPIVQGPSLLTFSLTVSDNYGLTSTNPSTVAILVTPTSFQNNNALYNNNNNIINNNGVGNGLNQPLNPNQSVRPFPSLPAPSTAPLTSSQLPSQFSHLNSALKIPNQFASLQGGNVNPQSNASQNNQLQQQQPRNTLIPSSNFKNNVISPLSPSSSFKQQQQNTSQKPLNASANSTINSPAAAARTSNGTARTAIVVNPTATNNSTIIPNNQALKANPTGNNNSVNGSTNNKSSPTSNLSPMMTTRAQIQAAPSGSSNVVGTVPVGSHPSAVVFDTNNKKLYVTNFDSNTVSVIDPITNTPVTTIPVGTNPSGMTFDPRFGNIYVDNFGSNSVSVIDGNPCIDTGCTENQVIHTITGIPNPTGPARAAGIETSPNGNIFVPSQSTNAVYVIDAGSFAITQTITVGIGSQPNQAEYDPITHTVWVTNFGSNTVSVIDANPGSSNFGIVIVIIPVGTGPRTPVYDSLNEEVYVTNEGSNTVSVIDADPSNQTATYYRVIKTIAAGTNPEGAAFSPDNGYVYVSNLGSNDVYVIDGNPLTATSDTVLFFSPIPDRKSVV